MGDVFVPSQGARKLIQAANIRETEAREVQDLEPPIPYTEKHGIPVSPFQSIFTVRCRFHPQYFSQFTSER